MAEDLLRFLLWMGMVSGLFGVFIMPTEIPKEPPQSDGTEEREPLREQATYFFGGGSKTDVGALTCTYV